MTQGAFGARKTANGRKTACDVFAKVPAPKERIARRTLGRQARVLIFASDAFLRAPQAPCDMPLLVTARCRRVHCNANVTLTTVVMSFSMLVTSFMP